MSLTALDAYSTPRYSNREKEDGFYQEELKQTEDGPKQKQRVLVKIPTEIIQRAKGLAIFTTMRTGLWFSGAGGSGVVVARTKDGWSPPTGIMLHTAGLGFLVVRLFIPTQHFEIY